MEKTDWSRGKRTGRKNVVGRQSEVLSEAGKGGQGQVDIPQSVTGSFGKMVEATPQRRGQSILRATEQRCSQ